MAGTSGPAQVDVVRTRELVRGDKDALLLLDHEAGDHRNQVSAGPESQAGKSEVTDRMKSEIWSRRILTDSASMLVWAMKLGRLTAAVSE